MIACFNFSIPPTSINPNSDQLSESASMNVDLLGACVKCKEMTDGDVTLPLPGNENNTGKNQQDSKGVSVGELELQLKKLKELKVKGISRGDVELIPALETKITELKKAEGKKDDKK